MTGVPRTRNLARLRRIRARSPATSARPSGRSPRPGGSIVDMKALRRRSARARPPSPCLRGRRLPRSRWHSCRRSRWHSSRSTACPPCCGRRSGQHSLTRMTFRRPAGRTPTPVQRSATLAALLVLACSVSLRSEPAVAEDRFAFRVLASGLESPWEITWGPDGHLWVTEREGKRITRIDPANGSKTVAVAIPDAFQDSDHQGVLGMALHPNLLRQTGEDHVYVAYVYVASRAPVTLRARIARYTYDPSTRRLGNPVNVISGLPASNDHNAGRLVIGPDGTLFYSIGDQGANQAFNKCKLNRAMDLPSAAEVASGDWSAYQGKILRLNLDGSIPADNPMIANVRSHVYSYGHRNAQGLAFGPGGRLYSSEHGPKTDDEINLIQPGRNYGGRGSRATSTTRPTRTTTGRRRRRSPARPSPTTSFAPRRRCRDWPKVRSPTRTSPRRSRPSGPSRATLPSRARGAPATRAIPRSRPRASTSIRARRVPRRRFPTGARPCSCPA